MDAATEAASAANARGDPRKGLVVAGTYRVLGRLGSGGMGDVYEAEHVRLGSRVAVKLLRASGLADPKAVARFRREARAVAALRNDHVVSVFDCGELDDATPYLVMERLVGEDLKTLLAREGALSIRRAVKLVLDACRGLAVVHAAGLIHRDLKPANLFVVRHPGEAEHTKILDFGVAKALASEATHPGSLLGTVRYMAPEQLEDSASATASADVYALGAILYECITGVPAHRGETLQEIMFDILHRDAKLPSEAGELPRQLERVVLKAISRSASQRYETAQRLAEALAPFGALDQSARVVEQPDDTTLADQTDLTSGFRVRPQPRPRLGAGHWATVGALALGIGVGWLSRGSEPPPAEARSAAQAPAVLATEPAPPAAAVAEPSPTPSPAPAPAPPAARSSEPTQTAPPSLRRVPTTVRAPIPAPRSAPLGGRFDPKNPYAD